MRIQEARRYLVEGGPNAWEVFSGTQLMGHRRFGKKTVTKLVEEASYWWRAVEVNGWMEHTTFVLWVYKRETDNGGRCNLQ